jgi:hypothetical protein
VFNQVTQLADFHVAGRFESGMFKKILCVLCVLMSLTLGSKIVVVPVIDVHKSDVNNGFWLIVS